MAILIITGFLISLVAGMQIVEVAKANPTWGTPATPIPPITDPPQIIITSPSSEEYSNPVPLNITIIQPNSWLSQVNMTLPKLWVDNSDNVVVGQNTLRSITCIVDGQSFILWNGTYFGFGVTYYLPRITQFSALMSVSKGQHNLQVNVSAISEYAVEGIIPFAERSYNILAIQTTEFNVNNDSDSIFSPTLYNVKSSYEIWQDPDSTPSSTPTYSDSSMGTPSSTPSPNQTPSPSSPEFTARFVPSSLEVTIKNQPLANYVDTNDSNPSLYYGFRFKDHENIQDWNYAPIYYVGISSYGTYYKASASDYTVVSFPLGSYPLTGILGSGQVDLQVIALFGNEVPPNYENGSVNGFDGVTSGWSDVQTITIPISSSSPTATFTTLTPSPSIPEFPSWIVIPLVLAATLLIVFKRKGKRP